MQFELDENYVFVKWLRLHSRMEIYCQEAATIWILNCVRLCKAVDVWLMLEFIFILITCLRIDDSYRCLAPHVPLIPFGRCVIEPHHDVMRIYKVKPNSNKVHWTAMIKSFPMRNFSTHRWSFPDLTPLSFQRSKQWCMTFLYSFWTACA